VKLIDRCYTPGIARGLPKFDFCVGGKTANSSNSLFCNEGALKSSAIARGNDITESMFAKAYLSRLRNGLFEGPANAKPPALPVVMTCLASEGSPPDVATRQGFGILPICVIAHGNHGAYYHTWK